MHFLGCGFLVQFNLPLHYITSKSLYAIPHRCVTFVDQNIVTTRTSSSVFSPDSPSRYYEPPQGCPWTGWGFEVVPPSQIKSLTFLSKIKRPVSFLGHNQFAKSHDTKRDLFLTIAFVAISVSSCYNTNDTSPDTPVVRVEGGKGCAGWGGLEP